MPSLLFKRLDLDLIYLPFLEKALQLAANCQALGSEFHAISGHRSYTEQDALHAQGRTKPGRIVTNARGGQSLHQFGLAIDFCLDADAQRAGLQPDWRLTEYQVLADEAVKLGLESGLNWKSFREGPHVQAEIARHGITVAKLDELHRAGGLQAVWKYLDHFSWT